MVDFESMLNPHKEPSPNLMMALDGSSWAFPILAALLATAGGCAAWIKADQAAAALSIAGGISGAIGVLATNAASRVRDYRIEWAKAVAQLGADEADRIGRSLPSDW